MTTQNTMPDGGLPTDPATPPVATTRDPEATWAKPVDRLAMGAVPSDAINLNVSGKRLSGPLQRARMPW